MTTSIKVDAHAGWPVRVVHHNLSEIPGHPGSQMVSYIRPGAEATFYIHSHLHLTFAEVQDGDAKGMQAYQAWLAGTARVVDESPLVRVKDLPEAEVVKGVPDDANGQPRVVSAKTNAASHQDVQAAAGATLTTSSPAPRVVTGHIEPIKAKTVEPILKGHELGDSY